MDVSKEYSFSSCLTHFFYSFILHLILAWVKGYVGKRKKYHIVPIFGCCSTFIISDTLYLGQ